MTPPLRPSKPARARSAIAVAIAALFLATVLGRAAAQPVTPTDGEARCRWGDPAVLPGQAGFDARAFQESLSPCRWGEEPPGRGSDGLLWLAFPVPQAALRDPALFLPNVSGAAFEAWFGGRKVFADGTLVPGGWARTWHLEGHLVPLPPEALGQTIYLRLQTSLPMAVQLPQLGERADLLRAVVRHGLPVALAAALAIVLGLLALVFAAVRRERSFLSFAGIAIPLGLFILFEDDLVAALFGSARLNYLAVMISAFAVPPALVGFVRSTISTSRRRRLDIAFTVSAAATLLFTALALAGLPIVWVLFPWAPVALGSVATALWVSTIEVRQGNREGWYFLGGMLVFFVGVAAEFVSAAMGGSNGAATTLGAVAAIGSNLAVLLRRYALLTQVAREQARKLEAREADVRRLGEDLSNWATRLGEAVQGLRQAAETQAGALRQQAQALSELRATTGEIGQVTAITKAKADEVLGGAARAEAAGQKSDSAIAQTFSGLDAVLGAVGATAQQAATLGDRSEKLVGVVSAVKDLAAQSRLMALNAGLEAARAGEEGRGFAVVARELRRLAEASGTSAEQVARALKEIHGAVTETVRLADGGAHEVDEVLRQIRGSGEQLREVAAIAASAGANAREIAATVTQQDAAVHEILNALQILDAQTSGTNQALESAQQAAQRVQEVVTGLLEAAERARAKL